VVNVKKLGYIAKRHAGIPGYGEALAAFREKRPPAFTGR
jgi:hypothetical protein